VRKHITPASPVHDNGLAKEIVSGPVVWIQQFESDRDKIFGQKQHCSGRVVPQLFPIVAVKLNSGGGLRIYSDPFSPTDIRLFC
jgi:hypothetical protein